MANTSAVTSQRATCEAAEKAFYNHLFGPGMTFGCCAARHARYCATGAALLESLHSACQKLIAMESDDKHGHR